MIGHTLKGYLWIGVDFSDTAFEYFIRFLGICMWVDKRYYQALVKGLFLGLM